MLGRIRRVWRGDSVAIVISRDAAVYLQDMLIMDMEATAQARGMSIDDPNFHNTAELLDILEDYDVSAKHIREVLACLNSTLT